MTVRIRPASTRADLDAAARLFRAYVAGLVAETGVGKDVHKSDGEAAALPGPYAAPRGTILLAARPGQPPDGCVALRPLQGGTCEVKHLFVSPGARGAGLGRQLMQALIPWAQNAGYDRMLLDTLASLTRAVDLYQDLGFRRVAPYNDTAHRDILHFGRAL